MDKHHRINYIEFVAPDLSEIKIFYESAFGWKFTDYGPEYTAFTDGNFEGGFAKGNRQKACGPLVILYSENLENSLETVLNYGGEIIKPIFSFPGGRRFHFADPAGNELALWSEKR